jgi:hypothetical protein
MNDDSQLTTTLLYSQVCTGILLVLSEYMGYSSCESSGVLHFLLKCVGHKIYVDVDIEKDREANDERKERRGSSCFS